MSAAPLFPLFLKLAGRLVVVVGGGAIGARKAAELLAAGAQVVAVSPVFCEAFPRVAQRHVRRFTAGDCAGAVLVFSATGDAAVDADVSADAERHGALINVVDRAELCAFYSAAVVRRGALVVAVGTSGASPTLARTVRDRIDALLPPELAGVAAVLGRARPELLARLPSLAERASVVEGFVKSVWARLSSEASPSEQQLERELAQELPCTSR